MPMFPGRMGAALPPPMAGGQPISEEVADQAAEWLTLLMSGEATDAQRQHWAQWRTAHPDHDRAWTHIEGVVHRLRVVEPRAAYHALSPRAAPKSAARRKALNLLVLGGVAGAGGLLASRTGVWQHQMADYRTAVGERRTLALADGTSVTLNTASAVDLHYDSRYRLLRLVRGEILVATGHATTAQGTPDTRPFIVETAQGRIRAMGTRFEVRQMPEQTHVAVFEHAVQVTPAAGGPALTIQAGERTTFTRVGADGPTGILERHGAWARGQLLAEDMRLDDFLAELGRYRLGIVRCAPEVAGLRLSGVFPVGDTDRILATLPSVLPVKVRQRTRWWTTIEAAT